MEKCCFPKNFQIFYLHPSTKMAITPVLVEQIEKTQKTWILWFDGQWGLQVYPLSFQKTYVTSLVKFSTLIELRGEVCVVYLINCTFSNVIVYVDTITFKCGISKINICFHKNFIPALYFRIPCWESFCCGLAE